MKKEPKTKIDLSKCTIGQEVRLRDGRVEKVLSFETVAGENTCHLSGNVWLWNNGRYCKTRGKRSTLDVVEILPLRKKAKTATHMGQKVNVAENRTQSNLRAANKHLTSALKLLKGLCK